MLVQTLDENRSNFFNSKRTETELTMVKRKTVYFLREIETTKQVIILTEYQKGINLCSGYHNISKYANTSLFSWEGNFVLFANIFIFH